MTKKSTAATDYFFKSIQSISHLYITESRCTKSSSAFNSPVSNFLMYPTDTPSSVASSFCEISAAILIDLILFPMPKQSIISAILCRTFGYYRTFCQIVTQFCRFWRFFGFGKGIYSSERGRKILETYPKSQKLYSFFKVSEFDV